MSANSCEFLRGGMSPWQNVRVYGTDADHDPVSGILAEFLSLRDRGNYCKNAASNSINNDYNALEEL